MPKFADIDLFDYAALHQYGVSQLILIGIAKMMTVSAATVYAQGSWQFTIRLSQVETIKLSRNDCLIYKLTFIIILDVQVMI